jgi:hypothetical protein
VVVIRLFIALMCAIGLALSPVATAAAVAAPATMADCGMKGGMPDMPADHSKMDCCTPACQAPASAALLPEPDRTTDNLTDERELHAGPTVRELESLPRSGLDPPPRLPS